MWSMPLPVRSMMAIEDCSLPFRILDVGFSAPGGRPRIWYQRAVEISRNEHAQDDTTACAPSSTAASRTSPS